ncbi:MAG TPA: hypothetical protein VLY63_16200 [Anaerolineae bacterium]|nr:hypothetical protein [Anaerolineae bacterium]
MPAKRAASKQSQSTMVWAWVYAIGMVVAGLAGGLGFGTDILAYLLIVAAVLVGFFYFDHEDIGQFGLRVLILIGVHTGFEMVQGGVGEFLTGYFKGWVMFLMPVVLAMVLRWFWTKRIAPLF